MRKSLLFTLILSFTLATACGGEDKKRGKNGAATGLTAAEYDRLLNLNSMQQDNIDARDAVHNLAPLLSEKSKAMSEKISSPHCTKRGDIPENDLSGQIHQEAIEGTACPIYWFRRRGWTAENKTMMVVDNLEIKDPEYRKKWSPMAVRRMNGTYKIISVGTGSRVAGVVKIESLQTTDYGHITGTIVVNHTNNADSPFGSVVLTLNGRGWSSAGSITWQLRESGRSRLAYRVNTTLVDEEQFKALFSAYELDKYMANAIDMK